jgi:hypothetical protein
MSEWKMKHSRMMCTGIHLQITRLHVQAAAVVHLPFQTPFPAMVNAEHVNAGLKVRHAAVNMKIMIEQIYTRKYRIAGHNSFSCTVLQLIDSTGVLPAHYRHVFSEIGKLIQ